MPGTLVRTVARSDAYINGPGWRNGPPRKAERNAPWLGELGGALSLLPMIAMSRRAIIVRLLAGQRAREDVFADPTLKNDKQYVNGYDTDDDPGSKIAEFSEILGL